MSIFYVVATPIGNLEDITLRALKILKSVDLIAAEDTRVTRRLLLKYDIDTPMVSCHKHNETKRFQQITDALSIGQSIAMVSDAGMPTINDPGSLLLTAVTHAGFKVTIIPGPSALTSTLAISGMEINAFIYLGFIPRKTSERLTLFQLRMNETVPLLMLETPHRLRSTLKDLENVLGDRNIIVARELTKLHEEVFRGTITEAWLHFEEPKGEFTLLVEGTKEIETADQSRETAYQLLVQLREGGMRAKAAIAFATNQTGLPRKTLYKIWLESNN